MAAYERIERDVLQGRLLLALFAVGTHMGIRAIVATGEHGESEAALRHIRRHFITVDNLRAGVTRKVNATLAARDHRMVGPRHRVRVGLEEVRVLALELHDRVPRPIRRQRRDDLLARRAEERLYLLPAQEPFVGRGRRDDRGLAAVLHRGRDRVELRRHTRCERRRVRLHRTAPLPLTAETEEHRQHPPVPPRTTPRPAGLRSCTSTHCWCSRSWPNRHGRRS
ncbi:transposase [Streptomyces sp. 891-h]|nr:transposase [Streptomyces sp. 891-h]